MKRAMVKEPREKISNLWREILILFMVPYSEHDKYEVKLVKDEPHNEFALNGEDNSPLKMPKLSFLLL